MNAGARGFQDGPHKGKAGPFAIRSCNMNCRRKRGLEAGRAYRESARSAANRDRSVAGVTPAYGSEPHPRAAANELEQPYSILSLRSYSGADFWRLDQFGHLIARLNNRWFRCDWHQLCRRASLHQHRQQLTNSLVHGFCDARPYRPYRARADTQRAGTLPAGVRAKSPQSRVHRQTRSALPVRQCGYRPTSRRMPSHRRWSGRTG